MRWRAGGPVDRLAPAKAATPGQIALARILRRSPVMLPIPGTSLDDAELAAVDEASRSAEVAR